MCHSLGIALQNSYSTLKTHFYATQTPLFPEIHANLCIFHFFPPSSIFPLHRCEGTGLMRFFPSMPLAQDHRATVPTTGWILVLALLLAQQVQFVPTK